MNSICLKNFPANKRSANEQSDTKSDNAVANDHKAHIAPNGPANHGHANE